MLSQEERNKLKDKLRGTITKASSKVTTEVKAEQGDFKIVLSSNVIDHFYKNSKVASIKIAELDDELVSYIQQDPEEVTAYMLNELIAGFNTEVFEKTAANSVVNSETTHRIMEKQLADAALSLHPRTKETYPNITEKQLPANDERFGSFDVTTEKQLATEKSTPRGEPLTAGERKGEDRKTITEKQFDEQETAADRGEPGAILKENQLQAITDKQLRDLLSNHSWEQPTKITEDQLKGQKGELGRLTAQAANAIVKDALNAFGKTVVALGVTPDEVMNVVKAMTSHSSKETAIAGMIASKQNTDDINTAVKRAKFHGKVASVNTSNEAIALSILKQLSNIDADPRHIANALFAFANAKAISEKISTAANEVLTNNEPETKETETKSIFASILDGDPQPDGEIKVEGDASDGFYQYSGSIKEIGENPDNRDKFAEKAFNFCKTAVAKTAKVELDNLIPISMDVDTDKGTFDLVMKDASVVKPETLETRAERRRELAKEAQMPGGGMPAAGGDPTSQPMPPANGPDMGAPPPVESLTQQQPPEGGPEEGTGEPKPPGSICPACGSEDVDVDNGDFRCNGCGAEGSVFVEFEITKWPGTVEQSEEKAEGEEDKGFELGGTPDEAGLEGTAPPSMPVAASVILKPTTLEKLAAQKIKIGSVCPNCGGNHTDLMDNKGICYNCNTEYKVALFSHKNKPHKLAARFEWIVGGSEDCTDCNRLKLAFRNALKDYGMTFEQFHNTESWKDKANIILKMAKSGVLAPVLKQYKQALPIQKIAASVPARWQGYENVDKFPLQSCKERLNRRFGENATSMSGPCQGKKLADCVCKQLSALGIYSDGLAAKVAAVHMSNDPQEQFPTEECLQTIKKEGFRFKEAGVVCDCIRAAYASPEDMLIETISNTEIEKSAISKLSQFVSDDEDLDKPDFGGKETLPGEEVDAPMDDIPGDATVDTGPDVGGDVSETPEDLSMVEESPDVDIAPETEGLGEPGMGDGDVVDISFTLDRGTAEELYNAIDQAINKEPGLEGGGLDGEMTETLPGEGGEAPLGEELHDETMESPAEEAAETPEMQELEGDAGVEEHEVPGTLDNAEEVAPGALAKEGDEAKPCAKPCAAPMPMAAEDKAVVETPAAPPAAAPDKGCECKCEKHDKPESKPESKPKEKSENSEEKPEKKEKPDFAKSEDKEPEEKEETSEEKEASLNDLLMKMKKGTITKEANGLSNIIEGLLKQAKEEPEKFKYITEKSKKVTQNEAQKSVDFKIQDKGTMGFEDKFTAATPDVPRKKQLLGTEGSDMGVSDTDQPSVPAGSAAMKGEENYRPEKQTEVDGNQGGLQTVASYKVTATHKLYNGLKKLVASGKKSAKLNDGTEYNIKPNGKDFILTAQTKTVNNVKTIADDTDLGKIKEDKSHSLSGEPKPSEGVSEPDVPKAPNEGRLTREDTVSNSLKTPEIPAGGGMNANYDKNEKNKPEKQEEVLGTDKSTTMASNKADITKEATRIAGEMLKLNKIEASQLSDQITYLSQLPMPVLKQVENDLVKKADTNNEAGLEKTASKDSVEMAFVVPASTKVDRGNSLVENLQSLMTLNARNNECERIRNEQGNLDVFRK